MNDQNNMQKGGAQQNPPKQGGQAAPAPEGYWNAGRRVFMLWAIIVFAGFLGTHFDQANPNKINLYWLILSIVGLAYMKKQMSFQFADLKKIYLVWFWVVVFGLVVSVAAFYTPPLYYLAGYLGIFWLALMAVGHALTGVIDKKTVYITTTGMQVVAAVLAYAVEPLLVMQYLVAGVVGALAMVWLVLYA